jgi:hypothetical protein
MCATPLLGQKFCPKPLAHTSVLVFSACWPNGDGKQACVFPFFFGCCQRVLLVFLGVAAVQQLLMERIT